MKKLISIFLIGLSLSLSMSTATKAANTIFTMAPTSTNYCQGSSITLNYYYNGPAQLDGVSAFHFEVWINSAIPFWSGTQIGVDFGTDSLGYLKKYSSSSPGSVTVTIPGTYGSPTGNGYYIGVGMYLTTQTIPSGTNNPGAGRSIVVFSPIATPTISGNTNLCSGSPTTLTSTSMPSYLWSPGGQTTQNIIVTPTTTMTYSVSSTNSCGTASASVVVSVNPTPPTPVVTPGDTTICVGLTYTMCSDAPSGNQWWRYDIINGTVTAGINQCKTTSTLLPVGTYTFYTIVNTSGCPSDTSNQVVVVIDSCLMTGLTNVGSLSSDIAMYPNPATQTINITFGDAPIGSLIRIYNMNGQMVIEKSISSFSESINISALAKGLYSVTIVDVDANFIGTFIKE